MFLASRCIDVATIVSVPGRHRTWQGRNGVGDRWLRLWEVRGVWLCVAVCVLCLCVSVCGSVRVCLCACCGAVVREQLQAQIEEIRKLEERLDNRVRDVEAGVMLLIGAGEDITAAARSSWKLPFSLLIVLAMGIALAAYYRWRKVTQW